ncbi:hypothetical protein CDEF62S_04049 [Castellaniella defragrans]
MQSIAGAITHMFSTANGDKGSSENGTGKGVPTIAFAAQGCGSDCNHGPGADPGARVDARHRFCGEFPWRVAL